jgi:pimeloyl-ACP methyl ester carboxylesterase
MPTLQLENRSIYYTQRKPEQTPYPPLVLVHGAGGSHLDWSPELRRLPDTHVIALDLPGHGRSADTGFTDTLAYADDVCAVLDALKIERAIIAGHSMGGAIAQQIGLRMPERAAGLVLVGTGSRLPVEPTLTRRIMTETEQAVDWLIDWSWGANAPQEMKDLGRQRLLDTPPEVLQGDYVACQKFDAREHLEQISAPTLVLGAKDDRMVKLKFSVTLSERIPNATLVVIEGAGHMFPLEKAQEVADAVTRWLSERTWPGDR